MLVSGVDEPRGPRSSSWTPTTRGPFRGARRTRSKGVVGKAELLLVLDQPNFGNKGGFSRAPVPTPFLPRTAYSTGQTHVRGGRLARSHPRETTAESFNVNKPLFDSISDADLVLNSTVTNGTSVGGGQLPGYDTPHLPGPPSSTTRGVSRSASRAEAAPPARYTRLCFLRARPPPRRSRPSSPGRLWSCTGIPR